MEDVILVIISIIFVWFVWFTWFICYDKKLNTDNLKIAAQEIKDTASITVEEVNKPKAKAKFATKTKTTTKPKALKV
jgi:regulatory protein YycH of two-component signal transduction system YycFG